jgi:splicing factor U2AF subunit
VASGTDRKLVRGKWNFPEYSLPDPRVSPADIQVCDNVGDHLMGNVYARYEWEAEAGRATNELNDRWYAMRPLHCELSPVSDFKEACCRQNELGTCTREG